MISFFPLAQKLIHPAMTRSLFVRNARSLEKLKTAGVPDHVINNGKFLVFLKGSDCVLVDPKTKSLTWKTNELLPPEVTSNDSLRIVLDVEGENPEVCLFAVDLALTGSIEEIGDNLNGKFYNARKAIFVLNERESSLVSQARGLINFCRTTNFCKTCGSKLVLNSSGTLKTCPDCQKTHYPPLSPVGIVLIDNTAHSHVLLARGTHHPVGMFSCVAGFIEPGESLEGNIRREIAEEVGLDVENIEYYASQHWAMPESQLMMGCVATALSEDFDLDPVELQDGKWVDAQTLADAVDRAKLTTNIPDSSVNMPNKEKLVQHFLAAIVGAAANSSCAHTHGILVETPPPLCAKNDVAHLNKNTQIAKYLNHVTSF